VSNSHRYPISPHLDISWAGSLWGDREQASPIILWVLRLLSTFDQLRLLLVGGAFLYQSHQMTFLQVLWELTCCESTCTSRHHLVSEALHASFWCPLYHLQWNSLRVQSALHTWLTFLGKDQICWFSHESPSLLQFCTSSPMLWPIQWFYACMVYELTNYQLVVNWMKL